MKVLMVSYRMLSPCYGEDKLLMLLAQILVKHDSEVYIHILSKNMVLKLEKSSKIIIEKALPKHVDLVIIHHDVSLIKCSLIYSMMYRAPVVGLIYFIDRYTPIAFLRNIAGWFIAQGVACLLTFSKKVYSELRRFAIRRILYLPIVRIYHRKYSNFVLGYKRLGESIRVCYIGVVDDERINTGELVKLAYKLYESLHKRVEICIVARPDQRVREVDKYVRPWLRIVVIKKLLSDNEKQKFLCRCHVAIFTAKRIRFVVPPLFVVEAHSCGCLIYAPHLSDVLREEGLDNVYSSIDKLVKTIKTLRHDSVS